MQLKDFIKTSSGFRTLTGKFDRATESGEVETVDIPVLIKRLTGDEAIKLFDFISMKQTADDKKVKNFRKEVIAACIYEDEQTPMFTMEEAGKLEVSWSAELERLALRANGLSPEAKDDLGKS
jgi:hypothetical protein